MAESKALSRAERLFGHLSGPAPIYSLKNQECAAQQFKYSLANPLLSTEQRQFYEDNGYIVVKGLVTEDEIKSYEDQFKKVCNGEVARPPTMTVMRDVVLKHRKDVKGEHMITKIQDWQDDEVLFKYVTSPRILDYVQCFTGPNIKSIHTMLIHKPPGVGESGRHPFHQDLYYFPMRPADRIVCSWTAMQHVNRDNGCLSVLPGSHKTELRPHAYPNWGGKVNKAYHGILDLEPPEDRVHLVMDIGDTVFFHPLLIHGSGANKTQGYRKAISCHYASADCHWIDVKGTIQEEIANEVESMAASKAGAKIDFLDVWRYKSRLVRGKEAQLI